jgi:putative tryptophan/tyrosine transport system substrate-binding protein
MKRREFITLLGGAAVAWPLDVRAQQAALPVIGFLSNASPDLFANRLRAFRQGLQEAGYAEGRNVAVEFRWAENQNDRLPALAADLVHRQVAVIVAPGILSALAAKAATVTIPIVFEVSVDPVEGGLVASLARPGGNLTGVTSLNAELGPKRLELLHELVPTATTIALLVNPTNRAGAEAFLRGLQPTARALGLDLHIVNASTEHDFDTVFTTVVQLRAGALMIMPDIFFNARREQLATLAAHHAVPAIYQYREFAAAGGLTSYGTNDTKYYTLFGILKGDKPADLPVQQVTKVELFINLKSAKMLGLTVPPALLARADEVIE